MPGYRITKYDPAFRDASGRYTRSEWTAVSDVGRTFDGKVFERGEYLRVEGAYVSAVRSMMDALGIVELEVRDFEQHECLADDGPGQAVSLTEHCVVRGLEVESVVRLGLREVIWCRLVGANGFYVHFGHDYYLYAGWSDRRSEVIPAFAGLFVESFPSPYASEGEGLR